MSNLRLWRSQELKKLKQDMDCMFDNICAEFGLPPLGPAMPPASNMAIRDTGDRLLVKGTIRGLKPEDLEISISEKTLTIAGKAVCETATCKEMRSFSNQFLLPYKVDAENAQASYENGELSITLPRLKEPEKKTRPVNHTVDYSIAKGMPPAAREPF